ncbi:MAG: 6-phosphogluconolactonase [Ardenticatenia bacterium]|nr:MAG: 6-phosphogluconolactonase [Ardenticatenia bacterium]
MAISASGNLPQPLLQTEYRLFVFPTQEELGAAAAAYVARLAAAATRTCKRFYVAFSGGSLPGLLCPALTSTPLRTAIDWRAWYIFWADERCVPLDDAQSNYRLVREQLLDRVDIPPAQVYPVDTQLKPAAVAQAYQTVLAEVFRPLEGEIPRFDLILLGLGEDGHTASLFPWHPLLHENEHWVAAVHNSPKPPPERVTLTFPVLNSAREVVFITAGAGKAAALAGVFAPHVSPEVLPARLVRPPYGRVTWFVDQAAAAQL